MDAVVAHHVTKTYRIGGGRARIREMLPWPADRALQGLFPGWWARDTFNALEDVSVSMRAGSSTGIVGHNGAGKTTLLKVIAGVTDATVGNVSVRGRLGALIDAVVGFHPDLTGLENVYLLASMHGVSRRKLTARLPACLEFAEIGEMIDTQVKRYSAGMCARLGFAVVATLEPEILLVDEVLAVGDAAFQRKCLTWLHEYRARGGTLLFVSHNLSLVRNMTDRVIWLDHGRVAADGGPGAVLAQYARAMESRESTRRASRRRDVRKAMDALGQNRWGAGGVSIGDVRWEDARSGDEGLEISITFQSDGVGSAVFCVGFVDEGGREIGAAFSPPVSLAGHGGAVCCVIRPLPLQSGIYFPVVAVLSAEGLIRDRWKLDRALVVHGEANGVADFGAVSIPATWSPGDAGAADVEGSPGDEG